MVEKIESIETPKIETMIRTKAKLVDAVVDELDIKDLQKRLSTLQGLAFIIIIGQEDSIVDASETSPKYGRFGLHYRPNNPCMGGHLRKYGETHKNSTRPLDNWPTDLTQPFPDGKPVGLVYRYFVKKENKEYFEAMFSDASPWVSGFGGEDNRVLLLPPKIVGVGDYYNPSQLSYYGFYLKSGNFDPTVLVNLLKAAQKDSKLFLECQKKRLTITESLTFCQFFYGTTQMCPLQNAYSFDPNNSIRRMIEQRPVNLTGNRNPDGSFGSGLWGDGFDYNRPDMACVFRPDKSLDPREKKEKTFNVPKKFVEVKKQKGKDFLSFEECLEIFNEAKEYEG